MTNAILMASGLGTRMKPLTYTIPKPLIRVDNKPMIETVIKALEKANVDNIFVVVGYLSEQFNYLKEKYLNVEIIQNPDYAMANNISSVFYAKEKLLLADCFICEADLYVLNPNIFKINLEQSCYFAKMIEGHSEDWVFEVNKDNYITKIKKIGDNKYNMAGISYFTKKDAELLSKIIAKAYNDKHNRNLFWDEVVDKNLDKLKLKIEVVRENDVVEIDTVEELNKINYEVLNGHRKIS